MIDGIKVIYTPDAALKTRIMDDITFEQVHAAAKEEDDTPKEAEERQA